MTEKPLEWMNTRLPSTVLCILAAALFGFFGYQEWSADQSLNANGVRIEAVVTQNQGHGVFVSIPLESGATVEVQLGAVYGDPQVGESVPLVYDPQDPTRNKDERALGNPLIPGVAWAASGVFVILALLTWLRVIDWQKIYRFWR